jgi:heat shock protein 1/8
MFPPICLGIHFGTKDSCVSAFCEYEKTILIRNPRVIEIYDKENTPSVVSFDDLQVLFGNDASFSCSTPPDSTFYCINRLIGRKYDDAQFQDEVKGYTYKVYRGDGGRPVLRVATERYNYGKNEDGTFKPIELEPEQISALFLNYLKKGAYLKFSKPTNKAVITVPVNFIAYQRRATSEAAQIAGLDPVDIISEPIAACITYAYVTGYSDAERNVLVYDCGDELHTSIVKIKGGDFTLVATACDSHCSTDLIDQYICQQQIETIKREFGVDISAPEIEEREDKYARSRNELLCWIKPLKFGKLTRREIYIPSFIDGRDYQFYVSQSDIKGSLNCYREKFAGPIDIVFQQSGIDKSKITDVILIGVSSRIPAIQRFVSEEVGKPHYMLPYPDEAVADGASIYGACKLRRGAVRGFSDFNIREEITQMAVGFGFGNGKIDIQIPRNTLIPCTSQWTKFTKTIDTSSDKDLISLHVYRGDSTDTRLSYCIGKFDIEIKTKDHPSPTAIIYARISITEDGITVHTAESEAPPTSDIYKRYFITEDQIIHTEDKIVFLREQNEWYISSYKPYVVYHQKLVKVLAKIDSCRNRFTKDAKLRKSIKDAINEIRKEVTSKYDDDNKMTEEEFESYIKRAEDAVRAIVPGYKRPEAVQKEIDEEP